MSTRSAKKRSSAAAEVVEHIRAAAFLHADVGALLVQSAKNDGVSLTELHKSLVAATGVVDKARKAEQRLVCHDCRKRDDAAIACECCEWAWCAKCVVKHRCPGECGEDEDADEDEDEDGDAEHAHVICDAAVCSERCEYCDKKFCRSCISKTTCNAATCAKCDNVDVREMCCPMCRDGW